MIKITRKYLFIIIALLFSVCRFWGQQYDQTIKVGGECITEYLPLIKGKKVGVVGNQTSIIGDVHLVDTLRSLGIEVIKVFAPEHGFRGTADAGEKIEDGKDTKTGIPIISLYGRKNRKPSMEKLKGIDIIVFDLQDVGVRFYTYISTMHYVMEACAENDISLIVLDRPNPNGFFIDGPILKEEHKSFIGMHPVPIAHGMTVGEYAQMINGEGWLNNKIKANLTVIECKNYVHSDYFKINVSPSPNLPTMSSIYLYPSLCFFEGTNVSVGRGTKIPFQQYGAPYLISDYSFVPKPSFGAKHPKREGETCYGFDLTLFGNSYMRTYGGLYFFWLVSAYDQCNNKSNFFRKDGFFDLLTGDENIKKMIIGGSSAKEIKESYRVELEQWNKDVREKYLLYNDFE